jgi:hypothetical protein
MREVKRDGTVSYGTDDEMGALDLLTPERLLAAAKLIQHGRVYDLDAGRSTGLPLGPGQPQLTVVSYRTSRGLMMTGDYFPDSPNRVGARLRLRVFSSSHCRSKSSVPPARCFAPSPLSKAVISKGTVV